VENSGELADGPSGCGEVNGGGCSFAWIFGVTRSAVFSGVGKNAGTNRDVVATLVNRS
jgi:hypothetical protein